jgi:hypothetical protein
MSYARTPTVGNVPPDTRWALSTVTGSSGRGTTVAINDPRLRGSRRHPLPAMLTLTTVAKLAGARNLYAVAQQEPSQSPGALRASSLQAIGPRLAIGTS